MFNVGSIQRENKRKKNPVFGGYCFGYVRLLKFRKNWSPDRRLVIDSLYVYDGSSLSAVGTTRRTVGRYLRHSNR